MVQRFAGEICGFGTTSGVRVVIGRWTSSPIGSFADAMVEHPGGDRVLIAPSVEVAELIGGLYAFDDTTISDVGAERLPGRLRFSGGPLIADVTIGDRDALGWALRCVPPALATSVLWARIIDPVARVTIARSAHYRSHGRRPGDLRRDRSSAGDRRSSELGWRRPRSIGRRRSARAVRVQLDADAPVDRHRDHDDPSTLSDATGHGSSDDGWYVPYVGAPTHSYT